MSKTVLNEQNHSRSALKLKYARNMEIEKLKAALAQALDQNDEVPFN